jgi:vacuolar-type H+-ATPase catalytic subunit A/Vma1
MNKNYYFNVFVKEAKQCKVSEEKLVEFVKLYGCNSVMEAVDEFGSIEEVLREYFVNQEQTEENGIYYLPWDKEDEYVEVLHEADFTLQYNLFNESNLD